MEGDCRANGGVMGSPARIEGRPVKPCFYFRQSRTPQEVNGHSGGGPSSFQPTLLENVLITLPEMRLSVALESNQAGNQSAVTVSLVLRTCLLS